MKYLFGFFLASAALALLAEAGLGVSAWFVVPATFGFSVLFNKVSQTQVGARSPWGQEWEAAAHELELSSHVRSDKNKFSTMRGEIDGHRVKVWSHRNGVPEIEVRFESGIGSLDIDPRRKPPRPTATMTGDPVFDEAFAVHSSDDQVMLTWLTPARREILTVLNDALDLGEVEEDELEVKLGTNEWTASELVQAVQLCVLVAQTLDRSHRSMQTPQDAVRESEMPQDAPLPSSKRDDGGLQDR